MADPAVLSFERRAVLREPNRRLAALVLLLPILGVAVCLGSLLWGISGWSAVQLILAWIPIRNRIFRENWRAKERTAKVRVTAEGVFVDGVLTIPAASIADGYVVVRGEKQGVRLVDARRAILTEIEVDDEAEASALLSAMGIEASRRRARFDVVFAGWAHKRWTYLSGGLITALLGLVVASLFFSHEWGRAVPALLYTVAMLTMIPAFIPAAMEIGADGILLRWWRVRRFIPYDTVQGIERHKLGVRIALKNGQKVAITLTGTAADRLLKETSAVTRVEAALANQRATVASHELAARLARGERDTSAWLREAKTVRDGKAGYREGAVREDDLWQVLEDPSAPEDARAAAAGVLRDGGAEAKRRIRVAAELTASPLLRVALDVAATDVEESDYEVAVEPLGLTRKRE